jgi:acyl-CoA synthetase (AMP-forming)/AMP-acid ligase II
VLEALAQRLATDPDGPYLDFAQPDGGGIQYTARQMDLESTRLAHALEALGLGRRDRVATLLDNRAEQVSSRSSRR